MFRENHWQVPRYENLMDVMDRCGNESTSEANPIVSKSFGEKRCLRRWFHDNDVLSSTDINRLLGVPLDQFRDSMMFLRYDAHNNLHLAVGKKVLYSVC